MSAGAPGFGALSVVLTTTACVPGAIFYADFAIRFILHLRYRHILLYRRYPKIKGKLKPTGSDPKLQVGLRVSP
jgi:hypothetical protein